jgi:hypothetical protein
MPRQQLVHLPSSPPLTRMTSERSDRDVWTGIFAHECSVNHSWSNLGECVKRCVEVASGLVMCVLLLFVESSVLPGLDVCLPLYFHTRRFILQRKSSQFTILEHLYNKPLLDAISLFARRKIASVCNPVTHTYTFVCDYTRVL